MADHDSVQDVLGGILHLTFDGEDRAVPTLKLRASREWLERQVRRLPLLLDALAGDQGSDGQRAFLDFSYEAGLEAILDYDRTDALGGREWLEEHADPAELYDALRRMARVAVPFGDDLQTLVVLLVSLNPQILQPPAVAGDAASASPRSTSSPSRSGTSPRRRSKSSSTRGS